MSALLSVDINNSSLTINRPLDSLSQLPSLQHSQYCSQSNTECLACELLSSSSIISMEEETPTIPQIQPQNQQCVQQQHKSRDSNKQHTANLKRFDFSCKIPHKKQSNEILFPNKPEILPLPQQFLIPPTRSYVPTKIKLHRLTKTTQQHIPMEIESQPESIHADVDENYIYIKDYQILSHLKQYFISTKENQYEFVSTGNGITSITHLLQFYRIWQIIKEGIDVGKLYIPNIPCDPSEDTFEYQLLSHFFIYPRPFLYPIESKQTPIVLQPPKIVCSTTKLHEETETNKEQIDLFCECDWEGLMNWENEDYKPYAYQKDIQYCIVCKKGNSVGQVQIICKEFEFAYHHYGLGNCTTIKQPIFVDNEFDENTIKTILSTFDAPPTMTSFKLIVLYSKQDITDLELFCKTVKIDNVHYLPYEILDSASSSYIFPRFCFGLYTHIRRYKPTLFPNTTAQALPPLTGNSHLLNEPLFVISPKPFGHKNKVFIAYKHHRVGVLSTMINYTGELEEVSFSETIEEMWNYWVNFIQSTTHKNWDITITKVGEIYDIEMQELEQLINDSKNSNNAIISNIFISCMDIHQTMLVSEEEFGLLVDNNGFYKINDQLAPPIEIKGECKATYYSITPSLNNVGSMVSGYTIHLYSSDEDELKLMLNVFHSLSYLNSDPLSSQRSSILPKHLHMLQRYDLFMDIALLCDK
ncbi:Uncharacterized protein QTN25_003231 [Entamoeba marina]